MYIEEIVEYKLSRHTSRLGTHRIGLGSFGLIL